MDNVGVQFDAQALVIGGGPSGAWAAEHLARRGVDVLLLEAGPPDTVKLCSGLLNAEGQHALGCELPTQVRRTPFKPRLEFHDLDNRLRLRYSPRYWNMDRPSFDAWLRERAGEAGARLEYERRVSRIELSSDGVAALTSAGPVMAKVVIDATGWRALGRRLASGGGFQPPDSDGGKDAAATVANLRTGRPRPIPHIHAFQGIVTSDLPEDSMWAVFETATTPYYGWLVPKGEGRFLLGAGFPQGADTTRRSREAAVVTDADPWGKLSYLFDHIRNIRYKVEPVDAKPEGTPITTITSTSQLWWGSGRLFTVGEAAGLVSPSSGDGIHFGLEHAHALAEELIAASAFNSHSADALHTEVESKIKGRLRSALSELRFNCVKSKVASMTWSRGIAARLLPLYLHRAVERVAL